MSCSRVIAATFATGIAATRVNASASNSIENPDPGRAQDTLTCRTPCSGHNTPGRRACSNALYWKKSMCRQVLSVVSCTGQAPSAQSLAGQANRAPPGKSRYTSSCAPSNSVRVTRHGALNPNAAVNNPSSSIPCDPLLRDHHGQSRSQRNHHPLVNPPRRDHTHLITQPT